MKWLILLISIIFVFLYLKNKLQKKGDKNKEIINELRKMFSKSPKPIYKPIKPIEEIKK
jgi:hypothetical protein